MRRGRSFQQMLGFLLSGLLVTSRLRAEEPSAAWNGAAELTHQGEQHVKDGNDALAARRFAEAATLDPSYGLAYLELAKIRERAGDLDEALRVYDVAVSRVPYFVIGYLARAAVERRLLLHERERISLRTAARLSEDPSVLRDIANRHAESRAWPAALAVWRKMRVLAELASEAKLLREAELHTRALAVLAAELDPVMAGARDRGWVRRSMSTLASRMTRP